MDEWYFRWRLCYVMQHYSGGLTRLIMIISPNGHRCWLDHWAYSLFVYYPVCCQCFINIFYWSPLHISYAWAFVDVISPETFLLKWSTYFATNVLMIFIEFWSLVNIKLIFLDCYFKSSSVTATGERWPDKLLLLVHHSVKKTWPSGFWVPFHWCLGTIAVQSIPV